MKSFTDEIISRQKREAVEAIEQEIKPVSWAWRNPAEKPPLMPTWVPAGKSNRFARSYWRVLAKVYEGRKDMSLPLRCTRMVVVIDGYDNQHKRLVHHEKCGQPAREVELQGLLTATKAILCQRHEEAARRESFVSKSGYALKKTRAFGPRSKHDGEPFLPFLKTKAG